MDWIHTYATPGQWAKIEEPDHVPDAGKMVRQLTPEESALVEAVNEWRKGYDSHPTYSNEIKVIQSAIALADKLKGKV